MEFKFCHSPDDALHTSGFLAQDACVLKLDAVIQAYAILNHGLLSGC